jgi:hypothetical protein
VRRSLTRVAHRSRVTWLQGDGCHSRPVSSIPIIPERGYLEPLRVVIAAGAPRRPSVGEQLYTKPSLLQQLASGTAAPATGARTAAVASPPSYAFNPFDESSWWTSASSGATVDTSA